MEIGDTIDVRGPSGRLIYHGRGDFEIKAVKRVDPSHNVYAKKIAMIAGNIKSLIIYFLDISLLNVIFIVHIRWYWYHTNVAVDQTNYQRS